MAQEKADYALEIMHFFINGDWRYINRRIYEPIEMLSPEERQMFSCDVRNIVWSEYLRDYVKGLSIWALKEDQIAPSCGLDQIMLKRKNLFDDMRLTMKPKINFREK